MKLPCLHVGVLGVAAMRVVLLGAGVTEAGEIPLAEGNSAAGQVDAEAGVTATGGGVTVTEAGVALTVGVSMAGVQGEAISAASKRKVTLNLVTDQSLMAANAGAGLAHNVPQYVLYVARINRSRSSCARYSRQLC